MVSETCILLGIILGRKLINLVNMFADVQFERFLGSLTDLTQKQADTLFELLDVDHSGELEFEEFYLVFCIMISAKVKRIPRAGF